MVLIDIQEGGENLATLFLVEALATLPRLEQRGFRQQWRYLREAFAVADQLVRRPLPGLDQAEQLELLLAFIVYRGRLLRRSVRRARLGV